MTVADLIKELEKLPPDAVMYVTDWDQPTTYDPVICIQPLDVPDLKGYALE